MGTGAAFRADDDRRLGFGLHQRDRGVEELEVVVVGIERRDAVAGRREQPDLERGAVVGTWESLHRDLGKLLGE